MKIRSDRTVHRRRLSDLLRSLGDDLAERSSRAEVRACAEAVPAGYEDARIRSYVLVLAERETRKCLAGEVCHALTAVR